MNTKTIIALSALLFVTLVSIVYAFVQQTVAKRAEMEALKQKQFAEEARIEADRQRVMAEKTMEQYQVALQDMEKLKMKCK